MSATSPPPPETKKPIDWLELTSRLLLPVVLACVGLYIPYKTHQAETAESKKRIEFERETGFVRMLASSNEDEQH